MIHNLKDDFKYTMDLIKNVKGKAGRETVASVSALRQQLKNLKNQGANKNQLDKVRFEALEAIKLDLVQNNSTEIQELNKKLYSIKEAYDKEYARDYSIHSREVETAKRRYAAMSKKELFEEADKYLSDEFPKDIDSNILDELSIQLKRNKYENFDSLREIMNKNNYDKPYYHNPVSEDILADIQCLSNGSEYVMLKTEDNKRTMVDLKEIDEYLEMDEQGEEE